MGTVRQFDDASIYWRFAALDRLMPVPYLICALAMCWLAPHVLPTALGCALFLAANLGLSAITRHRYQSGANERELQYWIGPIRAGLAGLGLPLLTCIGEGSNGAWLLSVVGCCFLPFVFSKRGSGVLAASLVGVLTSAAHLLSGASRDDFIASLVAAISVSLISGETVHALQSLVTRVRAAEAAKSDFLANVSHEIRTPMNGILGTLELISDSENSQDQRELARIGHRSARGLLTIINDVLDFSKIEAGKLKITPSPFLVRDLVGDMRTEFAPSAREYKTTLLMETASDFPEALFGDVTRVAQVLRNFLSNALKFARGRSVTLRLRLDTNEQGKTRQIFEVIDTGIGMTPDQLGRVFQKFEQAEAHTTKKFGGTGLGLAISQNLVQRMNGSIGAESTMGTGSRFWMSLSLPEHVGSLEAISAHLPVSIRHFNEESLPPTHAAGPTNNSPTNISEHSASSKTESAALNLRVLVVDDNKTNRLVAARLLKAIGCQAVVASSGQEAIEVCENQSFDVVLMDCQMPEMDGYEATQRIHALPRLAELPIIALTASALLENQERCAAAGMTGFLSKPVGKADLRELLVRTRGLAESQSRIKVGHKNKAERS